jgi:pyruvate kinase
MKRAKIVCTIGPASGEAKILSPLIRQGMDVARLNFSHGTLEDHRRYLQRIRRTAGALKKPVAILQDLQGIKLRIGPVAEGRITLSTGKHTQLKAGNAVSTPSCLYIRYPYLARDVLPGHRVLIDDGLISLKVVGKDGKNLTARIVQGGTVKNHKGVNLPDSRLRLSSFTAKDKIDLDWGIKMGVDYAAVSFVRTPGDLRKTRHYLESRHHRIPLIAKIEKPEAVENIDGILSAAEGIMVARGDLGVEMNPEEVPVIQKKLIAVATKKGKIVITATHMLESMTGNLRPTRAEVNDVANAVIDGSDALMLSAETSVGNYPTEAVEVMKRIIEHTEKSLPIGQSHKIGVLKQSDYPYAVAEAAAQAAIDIRAKAIIAFTHSGYTARLVSKFRPPVPIIAYTTSEEIQRNLSLSWGVTPLTMKPLKHTDEMVVAVEKDLRQKRMVKKGDTIVIIASSPLSTSGRTNFMRLHRIE